MLSIFSLTSHTIALTQCVVIIYRQVLVIEKYFIAKILENVQYQMNEFLFKSTIMLVDQYK